MTTMRTTVSAAPWLAGLVLLFLAPFVLGVTGIRGLLEVLFLAVAVMSLNLLTGFNGQPSIGHSALMGLGAYTTALAVQNYGWSYWTVLPLAILIAALVGAVAGIPALRIRGMNLALVTMALALVFPQIPVRFTDWTGGTAGLTVDRNLSAPASLGVSDVAWQYWVLLTITALVFLLIRNVMHSSIGRSLIAIRDQHVAAHTVGVNVKATKVAVFAASAAVAGVAGWMFTVANQFVSPGDFTVLVSINLLLGMAIGGSGTLVGPILGAVFLHYVPELLAAAGVNPQLTPAVYGVLLILLTFFLPQGLAGGARTVIQRLRGPRGGAVTPEKEPNSPRPVAA
ncbi:branched-chain amino acid ABC transporter permease [Streptosporangium sp. NPDC005286]|uniref:branched-chain amino acid ABC transporter permease n=1 Tax=Streptosporangium sp. NPDC005286 TaxID=3154463 RepID=UPI0033A61891